MKKKIIIISTLIFLTIIGTITIKNIFFKDSLTILYNQISDNKLGNMYRFKGENVNNYICFGTSDKNKCVHGKELYMYRIVGVTDSGQLKLIKKDALHKFNKEMFWDSNRYKKWNESDLFKRINGETYLENQYYFEDSTWIDKIEVSNWKHGTISPLFIYYDKEGTYGSDCDLILEKENEWTDNINAKIGLLYISDICYSSAVTNEFSTNSTWISLKSNDKHISKFYQHDGIYDEFLLDELWVYGCNGDLNSCYFSTTPDSVVPHTRGLYVRPVFYTKNNIKIISGNGEINNPFIIE